MIIYPKDEQAKIDTLLKDYPYSRITIRPVKYKQKTYMAVESSDLDLLKRISDMFVENRDPIISSI